MTWKIILVLFLFSIFLTAFGFYQNKTVIMMPQAIQSSNQVQKESTEEIVEVNTPSLEQIFSDEHNLEATLSAQRLRVIIATGDIIPARSVNIKVLQQKDFNWPYLKTFQITQGADITFSNLESPEIKKCPTTSEGMSFCGDYRNIEGLKFAGIDIVSLANNHAGNFGVEGIKETIKHLEDLRIDVVGTAFSNLVIKDIRGIKFAFLGFNDIGKNQPGVANVQDNNLSLEIINAKNKADVVVVTFHWGTEYKDFPDERQIFLGRLAIDSGADLVIGNHPHWIQGVEFYKNKFITYAHGNFVFDQMWSQKTREGVVGKYTFYDNQLIDVEYLPIQINDFGQPTLIDGKKGRIVLDQMKNISIKLSSQSQ